MKRLTPLLALCLAFGASVNVALALYLFLSQPYTPTPISFFASPADTWPIRVPARWPQQPESSERVHDLGRTLATYSTEPPNMNVNDVGIHHFHFIWDWRCGWPMRSLRSVVRSSSIDDDGAYVTGAGLFDVVEMGRLRPDELRSLCAWRADYLPTSPMPLGFAVNSLLFAAIPAAPVFLLGPIRRALRLRAGLCPRCKYPIGPSPVCTECGHALRKAPAHSVAR